MPKDAILLREAGGLGDILQVGSVVPLLKASGFMIHFYTLADPAILKVARMVQGIDRVHPLSVGVSERRPRSDKRHWMYPYLASVSSHAFLGRPEIGLKSRLFDLFCPAWQHEMDYALNGASPLSRAQVFVASCGFTPQLAEPTRISTPATTCLTEKVCNQIKAATWTFVSLWSRDLARSCHPSKSAQLVVQLAEELGPVVAFDYPKMKFETIAHPSIFWYPSDHTAVPREQAVDDACELGLRASRFITVDTFFLHLAGSLHKPITLLTGPTRAPVVAAHYFDFAGCEYQEHKCRGCYYQERLGFLAACRTSGCKVINAITPDEIVRTTRR